MLDSQKLLADIIMKINSPSDWFKIIPKKKKDEYFILHGVHHGLTIGMINNSNRELYLDLKKRGLIRYEELNNCYQARPTSKGKKYFNEIETEHNNWLRKYFPELFQK